MLFIEKQTTVKVKETLPWGGLLEECDAFIWCLMEKCPGLCTQLLVQPRLWD